MLCKTKSLPLTSHNLTLPKLDLTFPKFSYINSDQMVEHFKYYCPDADLNFTVVRKSDVLYNTFV